MQPLHGTVLMPNGAVPRSDYGAGFQYDIQIDGQHDVYTVGEKALRPLMTDPTVARQIMSDFDKARSNIMEARAALRRVRVKLEEDGQPDYELRQVEEFEVVLKNVLRYELTNETFRWRDIHEARKKGD